MTLNSNTDPNRKETKGNALKENIFENFERNTT